MSQNLGVPGVINCANSHFLRSPHLEVLWAVSKPQGTLGAEASVTTCDSWQSKTLILAGTTGCTEQLDVSCEDTPRCELFICSYCCGDVESCPWDLENTKCLIQEPVARHASARIIIPAALSSGEKDAMESAILSVWGASLRTAGGHG